MCDEKLAIAGAWAQPADEVPTADAMRVEGWRAWHASDF